MERMLHTGADVLAVAHIWIVKDGQPVAGAMKHAQNPHAITDLVEHEIVIDDDE